MQKAFVHYVQSIAPLQDPASGHWYQLVTMPKVSDNFLESSCTAMFAYTITMGLKMKILDKQLYGPMVEKSYQGLRNLSMKSGGAAYLIPTRVSGGTCVGDEHYYLTRKITEGTGFGYGSFYLIWNSL